MSTQTVRDILADLVGFKTVTGDYEQAAELLSYVRARTNGGMHEQDFVCNDYPSLILKTQKTAKPQLTLAVHIDVVPGDDGQFRLVADGDRLYGRGVYDMKFALACYLRLIDELRPNLRQYDFALMLTSDEEAAGNDGVRALLDNGYRTDMCVLPDGGDNWSIEAQVKGMWVSTIRAAGVSAHGSRPWEGSNPAQKLIRALHAIQQFNSNDPAGTTVAVTRLQADTAPTKIADQAEGVIDVRFMQLRDYEELRAQVHSIVAAHGCTIEPYAYIGPISQQIDHPLAVAFLDCAEQVTGKRPPPGLSYGSSDGRFFDQHNIPVLVMRPDGGGQHSPDEWISEQSLELYCQTLKRYVERVARLA